MEPTNRLYLGNLDPATTQHEVEQEMHRFGRTISIWVARSPPGFAFVEFHEVHCATAALEALNGVRLGMNDIKVQYAKHKGRLEPPKHEPPTKAQMQARGVKAQKHRAVLKNLPASFTWRELKDEMKRIGDVIYADVDPHGDGCAAASARSRTIPLLSCLWPPRGALATLARAS